MNDTVFFCAGGDLRQAQVCAELRRLGRVYSWGIKVGSGETELAAPEDIPEKPDVLVLPILGEGLEMTVGGQSVSLERLAAQVKSGGLVLGGRLNDEHRRLFSEMGLTAEDYYLRESLVIKNCLPTAEGALQIALNETSETVFGSRVLVLGFGRTAKCCARLFKAVGADCAVAARRSEALAAAWTEGMETFALDRLKDSVGSFDIIINTAPALLLTEDILSSAKKGCLIIDLASKPGGTDFTAAEALGLRAVHALALPGKTAPVTAGRLIAQTIEEILNERGKPSGER